MNMKPIFVIIIASKIMLAQDTLIRWEPEQQLTNDTFEIYGPCLACQDSIVHLVYMRSPRTGCGSIWYLRSTDHGESWAPPRLISDSRPRSTRNQFVISDENMHCVWIDFIDSINYHCLGYCRSTNRGESWEPYRYLGPCYQRNGIGVISDTILIIAYVRDSIPPNPPGLYFTRSIDNGITWTPYKFINNWWTNYNLSMVYNKGIFHTVFHGCPPNTWDKIYYMFTTNLGETWSTPVAIADSFLPKNPKLRKNSLDYLFTVWSDNKALNFFTDVVMFRKSTDNGITWTPEQRISTHHLVQYDVDLAVTETDAYAVWPKYFTCLEFRASTDLGDNWLSEETLCDTISDGTRVSASSQGWVFVSWTDYRTIPKQLYFRRGRRLPVAVREATNKEKCFFSISPNPANNFLSIKIPNQGGEKISIEVFNICGSKIWSKRIGRGNCKEIYWDTKDKKGRLIPAGIYFLRLNIGQSHNLRKIVIAR